MSLIARAPLFSVYNGVSKSARNGISIGVYHGANSYKHFGSSVSGISKVPAGVSYFSTFGALRHTHSHDNNTKSTVAGKENTDAAAGGHSHRHSHGHSHSHSDFPELDEMDLDQEDFTLHLNEKKQTPWTRVKDFFNPHKPLHSILTTTKPKENGTSTASSEDSHDDHDHTALGHSHSHASDPEAMKLYNSKDFWTNEGVKITWVGFGVNATMAVTKFFGGIYFHSQALVADAVHAVGDLVSDVLTLSTVKYSNQSPSSLFPLGYGKVETLGSLLVSSILLYAGFQIGWSSLIDILTPILPHSVLDVMATIPAHSHTHVHTSVPAVVDTATAVDAASQAHTHGHSHAVEIRETTNINAAWLALGSIVVKEWLFQATRKIGENLNSKVLIANAWHHRVDSMTSIVAVVTITSGYFLEIFWLDSVGGLLVSMLVMKVGISGIFQSFKELIDKALDREDPRYSNMEDKINVSLMKLDSKVVIKDLVVLPSGTNLNAQIVLGVGSWNKEYEHQLTLDKIGEISRSLRQDLKAEYHNLKTVTVEFNSAPVQEIVEEEKEEEVVEEGSKEEEAKEVKTNEEKK